MTRFFFFILIICFSLFISCSERKRENTDDHSVSLTIKKYSAVRNSRTSVTFILGKDVGVSNPYYSLANLYYRMSVEDKTEIVIDTIFSLLGVRNYLEKNPPKDGRPWGLINLVSHGNEFIDLSVNVYPDGPRSSAESMMKSIKDSIFKPLSKNIVDPQTLIYLHGCAVGQNKELLKSIGLAFGGYVNPIQVKASKLFEYYSFSSGNNNPQMIRHYFARVWYAYYNYDSIPDETRLVSQLCSAYPFDYENWHEAVGRQYQTNPSEIYHITFCVPVIWEDFYERKESLPVLNSKPKQAIWFSKNFDFKKLIKKTGVPMNYFNIRYYTATYQSDSTVYYSLKVKARAGVMCLIKPLINKVDNSLMIYEPYLPDQNDTDYFRYWNSYTDDWLAALPK
ncbi:MAG: hypothetical protein NTW49_01675 [Bacteroidia bacterium]|nr:hypothetical protein [Bacteroidia bacterium]